MVARLAQISWRDWGVPAVPFVTAQVELWITGPPDGLVREPRCLTGRLVRFTVIAIPLASWPYLTS